MMPLFRPGLPEWHKSQFDAPHAIRSLWHVPQNLPSMISDISTLLVPARILKPGSEWQAVQR